MPMSSAADADIQLFRPYMKKRGFAAKFAALHGIAQTNLSALINKNKEREGPRAAVQEFSRLSEQERDDMLLKGFNQLKNPFLEYCNNKEISVPEKTRSMLYEFDSVTGFAIERGPIGLRLLVDVSGESIDLKQHLDGISKLSSDQNIDCFVRISTNNTQPKLHCSESTSSSSLCEVIASSPLGTTIGTSNAIIYNQQQQPYVLTCYHNVSGVTVDGLTPDLNEIFRLNKLSFQKQFMAKLELCYKKGKFERDFERTSKLAFGIRSDVAFVPVKNIKYLHCCNENGQPLDDNDDTEKDLYTEDGHSDEEDGHSDEEDGYSEEDGQGDEEEYSSSQSSDIQETPLPEEANIIEENNFFEDSEIDSTYNAVPTIRESYLDRKITAFGVATGHMTGKIVKITEEKKNLYAKHLALDCVSNGGDSGALIILSSSTRVIGMLRGSNAKDQTIAFPLESISPMLHEFICPNCKQISYCFLDSTSLEELQTANTCVQNNQ